MTLAAVIKESQKDKEAWHYTSLQPFADLKLVAPVSTVAAADLPAPYARHRLVFVDGKLSMGCSSLDGLPEGLLTVDADHAGHYALTLGEQSCLAIDPIELLYINSDNDTETEAEATLTITLGKNSRLTLLERHVCKASALQVRYYKTHIKLDKQSKLVHGKIVCGQSHTVHLAQTDIVVQAGAFYDHFVLVVGGKMVRGDKNVRLEGEMAEARLVGGVLLDGPEHADFTNKIIHAVPYGTSHQIYKTVLAGRSHGVFQGKVVVEEGAQKADAYQLCRSLLLSKQAEMSAKPELEIYADDVKCSHGTAIGDLDEDALFYLLSRGIPEEEARQMLVEAFIGDLMDGIQSTEIEDAARQEVAQWLAR